MNPETPATETKVRPQCASGCGCGRPPVTNLLGRPLCEGCCRTAISRLPPGGLMAALAAHTGGTAVPQGAGAESPINALERRVAALERAAADQPALK